MSVLTLRPNANSTPLEQTAEPVDNNYARVDEETLSETDYCWWTSFYLDDQTKTDIYSFPNHSDESGTINSITVKAYAKYVKFKTISGTPTIKLAVKIGSTVYYDDAQNLTASTSLYTNSWATNPATSSAWTWTNIDDLLAGDQQYMPGASSKDNYFNTYCYQLWVEVDYTAGGGSTVKPHYYYLQQ
jgi:hypothetical protein